MGKIPKKVEDRLIQGIRKYQPIVTSLQGRDVNESDTVTLITDMLSEMLGYNKYTEITREQAIRGTYVDLAIKINGKIKLLIEVKAIGIDLKDNHLKQAVDYAANEGVEWTILTNGVMWQVYRVIFGKPIEHELVVEMNFLDLNYRNKTDIENLSVLTREATGKTALEEFHVQKQATNRFTISAILLSEPSLSLIRRQIRRMSPKIQVKVEEIEETIKNEIFKRELFDGDELKDATKKVKRASKKSLRSTTETKSENNLNETNDSTIVTSSVVLVE